MELKVTQTGQLGLWVLIITLRCGLETDSGMVFFVDDIDTADLLWTILIWVVVLLDLKFWKLLWTISTRTIWCN